MTDRPTNPQTPQEQIIEIADLAAMRSFAQGIAQEVRANRRLLILLDGEMGAGKTQFTRFLLEELGSEEACSPSFAIHNSYSTPNGSVEHMDLYRLESEDDLESTGFWDFFRAKEGVVIIEWAERLAAMGLADQLPRTWNRLQMTIEIPGAIESSERRVKLHRVSVR